MTPDAATTRPPRRPLRSLILPIVVGVLLILAILIVPPWLASWWSGLANETRRAIATGFLHAALAGYAAVLVFAIAGGTFALVRLVRGRREGQRRPISARILLLSVASMVALVLVEAGSWEFQQWRHRLPDMPAVPADSAESKSESSQSLEDDTSDDLVMLVLGESSGEGQPYQGWLSIGDVVAWQMEKAMPGRRVRVIMGATGGVPLAYALSVMEEQTERPDVVLLYSGHNEFQARWGWSRVVSYYDDDVVKWTRDGIVDRVGDWTPFCGVIRDAVDLQRIDKQPTLSENRALVERPVCEPATREGIRALFENELEVVARWCERAGALPIFVIPAGNDVGFDPDRSLMDPSTPRSEREAFGRAFDAAKAKQQSHESDAITAFRELIARQPSFAEAHYRLAQLLQEKGEIKEARAEYARARDLDGLPMRCPTEFQDAFRKIAGKHEILLIDGPRILQDLSPSKLLDDHVFHDGQHPTFRAYLALSQDVIDQLWGRGVLGLSKGVAPRIDPDEAASRFGLTPARWAEVCRRSARFWKLLATVRYDSRERQLRGDRYHEAGIAIDAGADPEAIQIPGFGVHPAGFP